MALKQAIKDAGRGLGIESYICNEIASNCDEKSDDKTAENRYREQYPELFKFVDIFNGVIKSVGSHPSGFVVSPIPLDENMGTMYTKESLYPVSQINMKEIDAQNYVKLDLLGLNNVTIIDKACKIIGIPFVTPDTIDDEDMDVWRSMREDTLGVFQMESASAQQYLKLLFRDTTIEKLREGAPELKMMSLLSIANGAIRPSGNSYRYDLSSGITKSYGHEALDKMMAETGSYMVFQETINRFLVEFCGFTESDADSVRRGLAKKSGTEQFLPDIKKGFLDTMTTIHKDTAEHAEEILDSFLQVIADASDYAFSLNHSQSYSYIGYVCAWLKYYYPVEFLTSILNSTSFSKKEKISEIMSLAKRKKVTINPIKFGKSGALYQPDLETHSIYKGVESISYMNTTVANQLLELSKAKNYESFTDLLVSIQENTSANSAQLEILIRLDYFKEFGNKYILIKVWEFFTNQYKRTLVEKTKVKRLAWIKEVERMLYCLPYEKETIEEQIEYERLKLGYPMTTFPEINENLYYVLDIDKKYTPKILLYRLSDGEESLFKMKKGKFYVRKNADSLYNDASSIYQGDVIRLTDTSEQFGNKKNADGEWVKTENIETFIEGFKIVRKSKERKLAELVE